MKKSVLFAAAMVVATSASALESVRQSGKALGDSGAAIVGSFQASKTFISDGFTASGNVSGAVSQDVGTSLTASKNLSLGISGQVSEVLTDSKNVIVKISTDMGEFSVQMSTAAYRAASTILTKGKALTVRVLGNLSNAASTSRKVSANALLGITAGISQGVASAVTASGESLNSQLLILIGADIDSLAQAVRAKQIQ